MAGTGFRACVCPHRCCDRDGHKLASLLPRLGSFDASTTSTVHALGGVCSWRTGHRSGCPTAEAVNLQQNYIADRVGSNFAPSTAGANVRSVRKIAEIDNSLCSPSDRPLLPQQQRALCRRAGGGNIAIAWVRCPCLSAPRLTPGASWAQRRAPQARVRTWRRCYDDGRPQRSCAPERASVDLRHSAIGAAGAGQSRFENQLRPSAGACAFSFRKNARQARQRMRYLPRLYILRRATVFCRPQGQQGAASPWRDATRHRWQRMHWGNCIAISGLPRSSSPLVVSARSENIEVGASARRFHRVQRAESAIESCSKRHIIAKGRAHLVSARTRAGPRASVMLHPHVLASTGIRLCPGTDPKCPIATQLTGPRQGQGLLVFWRQTAIRILS